MNSIMRFLMCVTLAFMGASAFAAGGSVICRIPIYGSTPFTWGDKYCHWSDDNDKSTVSTNNHGDNKPVTRGPKRAKPRR